MHKKLHYTVTILPAFIQPYARMTTKNILSTAANYINNEIQTRQEAAFFMNCESIRSFNRYYFRILKRINGWIIHLLKKISELTGENHYERAPHTLQSIKQKWAYFITLTHTYCDAVDRLKTGFPVVRENRICFIFAIFCMSIQGLGP